jgi:hypothetical protein
MHSGQVSQVEEEPRSLSGFRARSYAPTHCSCDLARPRFPLISVLGCYCVLQLDEPGDAPASSRFRAGGMCKVVEASREHETSASVAHLTLVPNEHTTETASAEAGAQRLLVAVAELQLRKEGELDQLSRRRLRMHRGDR